MSWAASRGRGMRAIKPFKASSRGWVKSSRPFHGLPVAFLPRRSGVAAAFRYANDTAFVVERKYTLPVVGATGGRFFPLLRPTQRRHRDPCGNIWLPESSSFSGRGGEPGAVRLASSRFALSRSPGWNLPAAPATVGGRIQWRLAGASRPVAAFLARVIAGGWHRTSVTFTHAAGDCRPLRRTDLVVALSQDAAFACIIFLGRELRHGC